MARLPPTAIPGAKAAPFCFLPGTALPLELDRNESTEELRFRANPF
jgi:hypothetical protein